MEQLAYLKRKTSFDEKRIDLLTRNLSLKNKEFSHAQFRYLDLSGADLKFTSLNDADLRGVNLSNATLSEDKFNNAKYDDETKFEGTPLDNEEVLEAANMEYIPDENDLKN